MFRHLDPRLTFSGTQRPRARAIPFPTRADARLGLSVLLAGLAALLAAALLSPPAVGQVFSSQPYVAAPDPAVEQLRSRLNSFESDLRRATDRTERLTFELAQAKKAAEEANAKVAELSARLAALEARSADALEEAPREQASEPAGPAPLDSDEPVNLLTPSSGTSAAAPAPAADIANLPQDEAGLLKEAKNLLLGGSYASAQQAITVYLETYGKGEAAHEAQYILADSLLYQENFQDAANAYGKLLSDYPKSENAPPSLVKLARAMRLMDKKSQACRTLDLLNQQYPKAPAAVKTMATAERQKAGCK